MTYKPTPMLHTRDFKANRSTPSQYHHATYNPYGMDNPPPLITPVECYDTTWILHTAALS